jgi:hypothetical protein
MALRHGSDVRKLRELRLSKSMQHQHSHQLAIFILQENQNDEQIRQDDKQKQE